MDLTMPLASRELTLQSCGDADGARGAPHSFTLADAPLTFDTAGWLLPGIVGLSPVLTCDVQAALGEALVRLGLVADCCHRRRLVDTLVDTFAEFLVEVGQVAPEPRTSWTLRSWLHHKDLVDVQRALRDSASHRRRPMDRARSAAASAASEVHLDELPLEGGPLTYGPRRTSVYAQLGLA